MAKEEMEELSLEDAFEKIEETLMRMQNDVPLEESFSLYKDGMELLKYCNEKIDKVEKQVLKLDEEGELNEF